MEEVEKVRYDRSELLTTLNVVQRYSLLYFIALTVSYILIITQGVKMTSGLAILTILSMVIIFLLMIPLWEISWTMLSEDGKELEGQTFNRYEIRDNMVGLFKISLYLILLMSIGFYEAILTYNQFVTGLHIWQLLTVGIIKLVFLIYTMYIFYQVVKQVETYYRENERLTSE